MRLIACSAALVAALAPPLARAQETVPPPRTGSPPPDTVGFPSDDSNAPKLAGTDVPPPKRTKFVAPAYPAEAKARGQRGIVILELVIDEQGRVASADVVRSVPPFDAAAVAAAREWEYEPTRVNGRPVRVRLTVPITFALKLPEMSRAEGVPEMRQGAGPAYPAGAEGTARVTAEVTLHPDGSVAEAAIRSGESPWAEALLQAVRTWRFAASLEPGAMTFMVEAEFVTPGRPGQPPRVSLALSSPKRREAVRAEPLAPGAPPAVPASPAAPPGTPGLTVPSPLAPGPPKGPAAVEPPPAPVPATLASGASPPPGAPPASAPPSAPTPAPPAVEVIAGGPRPVPGTAPSNQPGFSAVRDVTLGLGVPDLAKGRRPVVPPLARMAGARGEVEVEFAVDASGSASIQKVRGPDILQEAARQTVASWAFRRTSAERVYLVARFAFDGDMARATVRRSEE